ncbi:hypothetical protein ACSN7O_004720 [Enterobacter chuandaensis]
MIRNIFITILTSLIYIFNYVAVTSSASAATISYNTYITYINPGEYHSDGYHTPNSNEWNKLFVKFRVPSSCVLRTGNISIGTHRGNATKYEPTISSKEFKEGDYTMVFGPDDRYFESVGTAAEGVIILNDSQTTLECKHSADSNALSQLFQFQVHQNDHTIAYHAYVHNITLGTRTGTQCEIEVPDNIKLLPGNRTLQLLKDHSAKCDIPILINDSEDVNETLMIPMKNREGGTEQISYDRKSNTLKWNTESWRAGLYTGSITVKLKTP